MARKQIKVSRIMLFIWFILAGTIFVLTPQKWTNNFQFAFARIFQWPLALGRNISLSGQSHQDDPALLSHREAQYQNHIANIEQQLLQKNQKIEHLQKIRDRFTSLEGAKLLMAEIIKISADSSNAEIIINRGQNDGLAAKQYVLGDNCVIGVVSDVSNRQARVKLVTDRSFITPIKIPETKAGGIMQGNGDNSATITMMKTKPQLGNKVYINEVAGLLDVAMVTGKVTQCKRNEKNPMLWDIIVKPACDIQSLNTVAVIIMNPGK